MNLLSYLGAKLKDDAVLALLENLDLSVTYHVDRTHENIPDSYSAACREFGFELSFDETQTLATIFCYVQPRDNFHPIDPDVIGAPVFSSLSAAQMAAAAERVKFKVFENVEFLGRRTSAIRLEYTDHWRHYEFGSNELSLVTLMRPTNGAA